MRTYLTCGYAGRVDGRIPSALIGPFEFGSPQRMPNAKRREPKLLETVGLQTHETMQWTPELDALLNQCAFSAGYDFAATCDALRLRAERLRVDW